MAAARSLRQDHIRIDPSAVVLPPYSEHHGQELCVPGWLLWLQVAFSTMLLVLFLVTLARSRDQNRTIQRLQQRLEVLENSRALDPTPALSEQLRSTVERLQTLEKQEGSRREAMDQEREQLQEDLRKLRQAAMQPSAPSGASSDAGAGARSGAPGAPEARSSSPPSLMRPFLPPRKPAATPVLRPPSDARY
jgi:TolA-binding protein